MENPLVSVICLCYNHEDFIAESVESVMEQSYRPVELIIVDDHSRDGSRNKIGKLKSRYPGIKSLFLGRNQGNCKAFNAGLALAGGTYFIDLAADDVLMPDRIMRGIEAFREYDDSYGINFTDALYINEKSKPLHGHYPRNKQGKLKKPVPEGDIYPELLERYMICTPTMMIKKKVMVELKGYDETLAYEDFDFWVRSSRYFKYCFTDEILIKKRMVSGSLSTKQYIKKSAILESTYRVCLKAEKLNESTREKKALVKRCRYEFCKSVLSGNHAIGKKFAELILRNTTSPAEKIFLKMITCMT